MSRADLNLRCLSGLVPSIAVLANVIPDQFKNSRIYLIGCRTLQQTNVSSLAWIDFVVSRRGCQLFLGGSKGHSARGRPGHGHPVSPYGWDEFSGRIWNKI